VPEGESLFSVANKNVAIIPQIESLAGLANVEAIMQNPGVDMVMVGGESPFPFVPALVVCTLPVVPNI
jgi:hypothetical protein